MLYLKKITKYDIPLSHQATTPTIGDQILPQHQPVYISQRETLEPIAGAYTLDILNSGPIAAILIDCPKANGEDGPRTRYVDRNEEAYIVNESGETITVINGRKNATISGNSLTVNAEALKFTGDFYLSEALDMKNRGQTLVHARTKIVLSAPEGIDVNKLIREVKDQFPVLK